VSNTREDPWTPAARAAVARWDPRETLGRKLTTFLVVGGCRLWMQALNRTHIEGVEHLDAGIRKGRGLLTVSNHVALFDDPLLTSCLIGPDWTRARWIAADAHNFFGSTLKATVFNAGKCVPVVRGAGTDQPGMTFLAERLAMGDWVHVFPEGGRTRDPDARLRQPLKRGLAQLIQVARPWVLVFHHQGMRQVQPIGARLPRIGRRVQVRLTAPVDSDLELADHTEEDITKWATERLLELERHARGDGP